MEYWRGWRSSWLKWVPTSEDLLSSAESKLFKCFKIPIKEYFVPIKEDMEIRTIESEDDTEKTPLVLLHGFGSGVGLWALNFKSLAEKRKVYAFDMMGFGRSARPDFPSDGAEAEELFIQSIEQWREKMGLEKFILLGHSFGGYLSASYAISHPNRVRHLIMADPWGMPEKDPGENRSTMPLWVKGVAGVLSLFNPLASIRAVGPAGPSVLRKVRPDLDRKFNAHSETEDNRVTDYIYHINAQKPSGEIAFMSLTIPYGWPKYPMIHRIKEMDENVPVTLLYGSRSWMDSGSGYSVKYLRESSYVDVRIIKGAGHHVYADKPDDFNKEVNVVCEKVDESLDSKCHSDVKSDSSREEWDFINPTS